MKPLFRSLIVALALGGLVHAGTLEEDFRTPPMAARPYVWWHWMGPNFSKEGITKDLEAMKDSGIGGATILNITSSVQNNAAPTGSNPWPEQTFRSPAYWEAVRHAAAEADRLGLELGMHNTPGYSTTGGPWIDEERSMQKLFWSTVEVKGSTTVNLKLPRPTLRMPHSTFYHDIAVLAVPAGKHIVPRKEILDLTAQCTGPGELSWDAPAGSWIVYRLGHGSTMRPPTPLPDDLAGKALEVDKMSLDQTRFHWTNVIEPMQKELGPLVGKSLRHFLIDSYEAGIQNWTPGFREEFTRRKGYDPVPWLMTISALTKNEHPSRPGRERTIETAEQTERFEWDYRDVVATLFHAHGWQPAADMIHAAGCSLQWEPYAGPFDTPAGAALADVPMVEFWTHTAGGASPAVVGAARAAGRRAIGAEAFSGAPFTSRWTETPAMLRTSGDGAFGGGVNRLVLHHWVHQPFADTFKPGLGMGWWGTHFGRHQTWAQLGKEFYRYLGRCQALLQHGETPVHYVNVGVSTDRDADLITVRSFLDDVRVENGMIVVPSGRRYSLVRVPHEGSLLPEVVHQIRRVLADGGTVVAERPDRSPSLAGYPQCDAEVRALAADIWGDAAWKGRLYADLPTALKARGLRPTVELVPPRRGLFATQHRRDAEGDIFFISNRQDQPATQAWSFAVADRQPEIWDPETGTIELAAGWREAGGRTEVDITLGGGKSMFVVFREHATGVRRPVAKPAAVRALAGRWTVSLDPMVGERSTIELESLKSLSDHPDPSVKYFSGTATYRTSFTLDAVPDRMDLDLGDVRDLVGVTVNGQDCGVWWHPPFVREVSRALRAGENTLELAVVNTWHNRLVGDEQFPADFDWDKPPPPAVVNGQSIDLGRAMKAYPDWFLENRPRPEAGRKAFTVWYYHRQDTPLIPSGLLGPVRLQTFVAP